MALSKIQNNSYEDTAVHGQRNLIINGAMQVAQRGTSDTGVTTATYLIDRFRGRTTAGSIDLSQSTTAPAGFTNSFKVAVNTTNAFGTASDEAYFEQLVEAQNLQHLQYGLSTAQKITLSFWVRSSVAGTYGIWFYQDDATKDYEVSYTIDSADTWEKKSVTIDGNTADAIDNNNESGIRVRWYLDGGSDRRGTISSSWATSSSTSPRLPTGAPAWMNGSNDWYITGVQLEVGETATDFEHRSYGDELRRCQRYYYQTLTGAAYQRHGLGVAVSTSFVDMPYRLPQTMRTRPTTTKSGSMSVESNTTKSVSAVTISTNSSSADTVRYGITCSTTLTVGYGYYLFNGNDANAYLTFDAEL